MAVARPRILLVHGWGADRRSWSEIEELIEPWADVVAPDLRGHGTRSGAPGPFSVARLADDLAALVGDIPVFAVGHSMGGQIVAALAVRYPQLVTGACVVAPAYGADDAELRQAPQQLAALQLRGAAAGVEFVDRAFADQSGSSLHRATRAAMKATPGRVLADLYESMYLATDSFGHRVATRDFLANLTQPFFSLYSNQQAADFAAELSWPAGSAVEVWQHVGHYLHQEQPHRFARIVRNSHR